MAEQTNLFGDKKVSESEWVTIEVELLTPPMFQLGKRTGNPYCMFAVKQKGNADTIQVMGFKEFCESIKGIGVGDKISLRGRWDDKQKFVATAVYKPGDKKAKSDPRYEIIRQYGSLEKYKEQRKEHYERQKEAGLVPVYGVTNSGAKSTVQWKRQCECVFDTGCKAWKSKTDWICEVFGPEAVSREMRDIIGSSAAVETERTTSGFSRIKALPWAERIWAYIDMKVEATNVSFVPFKKAVPVVPERKEEPNPFATQVTKVEAAVFPVG